MAIVRCTRPFCRHLFDLGEDRLGTNVTCPACKNLVSATPAADREDGETDERAPQPRLPFEALIANVRSLWNVGSIFRTADAAGVRHLHLCGITGYPPRKEISKTALGAERWVDWSHTLDAAHKLRLLRDSGSLLVALERTEGSVRCDELDTARRMQEAGCSSVCLIAGNEVAGVSSALLDLAQVHIELPMRGSKGSLNVAVAFGIAAFAISAGLESWQRSPGE